MLLVILVTTGGSRTATPPEYTLPPLPRRSVVERTFSWINRRRRTVRDYERHPDHHAAMVQ